MNFHVNSQSHTSVTFLPYSLEKSSDQIRNSKFILFYVFYILHFGFNVLFVCSQPLSPSESNGIIVSHEVSCYLLDTLLERKVVLEPSNSTEIKLGMSDCVISVVARNNAGSSPPSRITSVEFPSGECSQLRVGHLQSLENTWESSLIEK